MSRSSRVIFTDNKQSDRGIMSFILAVISLCSVLFCVIYSYVKGGGVIQLRFGAALALTLVFSVIGIVLGALSRSEADTYRALPTLGLILNTLSVLFLAALLWIGLS